MFGRKSSGKEGKLEKEVCLFEVLRVGDEETDGKVYVKVRIVSGPKNYQLNGKAYDFGEMWRDKVFKMPWSDYKEIVGDARPEGGELVAYKPDRLVDYSKSQIRARNRERLNSEVASDLLQKDDSGSIDIENLAELVENEANSKESS